MEHRLYNHATREDPALGTAPDREIALLYVETCPSMTHPVRFWGDCRIERAAYNLQIGEFATIVQVM